MTLEEIFKTDIIYALLITLKSPIIGLDNYRDYYKPNTNIKVPVYERVTVIKYGKVDSVSNLDKRMQNIKHEYSAINIRILFLVKSIDLNVKSLALLEKSFKNYINKETNCSLKISTMRSDGIYKIPQEFVSVSFEFLNNFIVFFSSNYSQYSEIVYDPYELQNIYSEETFNQIIDTKIKENDLVLDTNINNLSLEEIRYIKEYQISTKLYKTNRRQEFMKLIDELPELISIN